MRLLVTRPEPEATALAERLRGLGHTVLVQPLMRIELAPEPASLPSGPAAVVVTSRNGVRALAAWPGATAWHRLPAYAVGEATAAALRNAGFHDVRIGAGDGAALAALIAAERTAAEGLIVVVAGRDRAIDMAAALPGLSVKTIEAYRGIAATALAPDVHAAIAAHDLDGVLLYSRRTAAIFADLVDAEDLADELADAALFCLSREVAEPVAILAPRRIAIAARPDEESLLAAVAAAVAPPG